MKKIVFAPQGFKESLTGIEIAEAMAVGARKVWPDAECVLVPVADGGDGNDAANFRIGSGALFYE